MKIAYAVKSGSELNRYSRVHHCYNSKTRQINNIKYTPYTAHKQLNTMRQKTGVRWGF